MVDYNKGFALPSWITKYLTHSEVEDLAKSVRVLEKDTCVEIVSMVVGKSTATSHVFWILFLLLLSIAIEVDVLYFSGFDGWLRLGLFFGEVILTGGIAWGLSCSHFFQRLFTHDSDMASQVALRAQVEFHNQKLTETAGRTGILIFVSLMEHRVMVLADKSISDKLPADTWNIVVENLIKDIKTARLSVGLKKSVEHISKLVTPLFPAQDSNPNELTDYLIIEGAKSDDD